VSWLTVKLLAYVCAALLLASVIAGTGWALEDAAHDRTKAEHQAANDRAAREFAEAARKAEQDHAKAMAAIGAQHLKELDDAKRKSEKLVADLRTGAVRLRDHWASCATQRLSDPVAAAARAAEQDRLRRESLGRVRDLVAACQAQRDGLIGVVERDRR
jgi:hypothetical protein